MIPVNYPGHAAADTLGEESFMSDSQEERLLVNIKLLKSPVFITMPFRGK